MTVASLPVREGQRRAARLSAQAVEALRRARRHFAPAERLNITQWSKRRRYLHSGPMAGNLFDWDLTPALKGIVAALQEAWVKEVWVQKSAQVGYTQGVDLNWFGWTVEIDPAPFLVLFAKDGAGTRFMREKVEPMIRATPTVLARIPLDARSARNTKDFKGFPGGYLQLTGTKIAGNVKSSDVKRVAVQEPDDTGKNVQGQGDAIALGRERIKAYPDGQMLVGGTPTIKGLSKIVAGMERTDKRRMFVACPHCRHEQTLRWSQVRWSEDAETHHPIYGTHRPENARYLCEAEGCGALWSDEEKAQAIKEASNQPDYGYRATAAGGGRVVGFYINELYSLFHESRMGLLAQKFLDAAHALKSGDDTLMRSFVNNSLGEPWEIKGNSPELEELSERGEDYPLWSCPAGGLVAVCFVDVQRGGEASGEPRLEYLVVAYGREMESWRVASGQVIGNPMEDATWDALDTVLATPIRIVGGGQLHIEAQGVDSGDGMTTEKVYAYVRRRQRHSRRVFATKGDGKRGRPIFSPPKAEDLTHRDRAARWGIKLYLIGTDSAKDTLSARLKLCEKQSDGRTVTGRGPGRMHWPAAIGERYLQQITAEVKVPDKNGRPTWTQKAGEANEMLDCEVGCLHLAHKLRLPQMTEAWWAARDVAVRQRVMEAVAPAQPSSAIPTPRQVTRGTTSQQNSFLWSPRDES